MSLKAIDIVGGGLAGLSLGISLRRCDVPVTLWEKGCYPRHRVCGEVLSGAGCEVLDRLGLLDLVVNAGARAGQTAVFYSGQQRTRTFPISPHALCVARYTLDHLLARQFRQLGGDLREQQRWPNEGFAEGVVRSSGRPIDAKESGWRWLGVKAHYRGVPMVADVEMHVLPSGYVGLCQLPGDQVNVCGLFRRADGSNRSVSDTKHWLQGPGTTALHAKLAVAECDAESLCAVGGFALRPRWGTGCSECRLGDALTMIPPLTGNGMSMALEAAEIAAPLLAAYSQGGISWTEAQRQIAYACDARFRRRLRSARLLHRALFTHLGRELLLVAARSGWLWKALFTLTR